MLAGAVHDRLTWVSPAVVVRPVGAPAVVIGVDNDELDEYELVPMALTAATRKMYAVPFVRPVTVADVAVDTPSANVVQEAPELLDHCTA